MIGYELWGLTLVHFLWQGLLVAAGLAFALRGLHRAGPEVRYAVSVSALVLMAVFPALTVWSIDAGSGEIAVAAWESLPWIEGPASAPRPAGMVYAGPSTTDLTDGTGRTANVGPLGRAGAVAPALLARTRTTIQPYLAWIVAAWTLGVLFLSIRLLGGWMRLRGLTRLDVSPVPSSVRRTVRELCARLAVSRPVRLVRSARVTVPAVVGWIRPVILLPASALTGLSPDQLRVVLAHELAHVRRHDYVVNLLQAVIETILFYHPAVWWVSRRIREEREHCCDDLALSVCHDRRHYVSALLELETLCATTPRLAMGADGASLVMRARRMLFPDAVGDDALPRRSVALSAATLALAMAAACVSGPFIAQPAGLAGPSQYEIGGDTDATSTAMVFIGEAFADKVFRYEVAAGGEAVLDREITTNVSQPGGIAFSPTGEMFVSNRTGSVARYLEPEGAVTPNGLITAAGTGAPFGQPHWLTFRGSELFLAQASGAVLRFTFDRSGAASFSGRLSAARSSRGIQTRPATGELFVSSLENSIQRFAFDASGDASAQAPMQGAGTNLHGMTFTPWGELLVADYFGDRIARFTFDGEGRPVPNGTVAGGDMAGPIDLDFSPWGELFVTNHNQVPGRVTRWRFDADDASATASYTGSFSVPGNLGGIQFSAR